MQSANLITGQMLVALEFEPDAPPAKVTTEDGAFVMPTTESGGFSGLEASATELLSKVNTMPFDAIGSNLSAYLRGIERPRQRPADSNRR